MTIRVGILLFDGVDELDAIGPARIFWALGDLRPFVPPFPDVDVLLVSEDGAPVVGGNGMTLSATASYASAGSLDVLVATGGASDSGADTGRVFQQTHRPTLDYLCADHGTIASVCTGSFLLAAAGLLHGRRAATHWTARDDLAREHPSVTVVAERVVDEGRVLTAGGVTSGLDLAFHLVERLLGPQIRTAAELAVEASTPGDA